MILHIIPARLGAQRLPGKPLADIGGRPMIIHVWERAIQSHTGRVVVAAAEPEIIDVIQERGGEAVLTSPEAPTGSDRVYEALQKLDPDERYPIVCNIQGDMPFIDPASIQKAVQTLIDRPDFDIVTLAAPIQQESEKHTPHVVKVVMAPHHADVGRALYFSRQRIPSGDGGSCLHHIGVYAYRRQALATFVALPPSALERQERLEQLRALEHGLRVGVCLVPEAPLSIDTPEDLACAQRVYSSSQQRESTQPNTFQGSPPHRHHEPMKWA